MSTNGQKPMIYTIGYGDRTPDAFVDLLQRYQIVCLIDVRSYPFSQHQPWFSRDRLQEMLKQFDIQYIWMGHLLGDKPTDLNCYTRGRLDYAKYQTSPSFRQGLLQLHSAWNVQLRFALMSQALKPQPCHRAKLIAEALVERGIEVAHIDEHGRLLPHRQLRVRSAEAASHPWEMASCWGHERQRQRQRQRQHQQTTQTYPPDKVGAAQPILRR